MPKITLIRPEPLPAPLGACRALLVYPSVPEGMRVHCLPNDMHAPHLRAGEWVILDPSDRDLVHGELFVVRQSAGPIVWQVKLTEIESPRDHNPARPTAMLRPLNSPRLTFDANGRLETAQLGRWYAADGPIYLEYLRDMIEGRVIGIYGPAGGL